MDSIHKTVLLKETIDGLDLPKGAVVIDATFGGGGHSLEVCRRYPDAQIIAFDADGHALERAKQKFADMGCDITLVNENFRSLDKVLSRDAYNLSNLLVDAIIFDLGLSSDQLENSGRGFSFIKDEPLIMTMKENPRPEDVTAHDVVNTWSEESLADIIYGYGEERFARRIARGIVEAREASEKGEIKSTLELAEIIKRSIPARFQKGKIHPTTKTFQAIRIAVNDELGALSEGLAKGFELLGTGGTMAVISFHSLEDRIVKRFYKQKEKEGLATIWNKKVILASKEEIKNNPRSRSAKLRVLKKSNHKP